MQRNPLENLWPSIYVHLKCSQAEVVILGVWQQHQNDS